MPGEDLQQRRLARAVGADQPDRLAGADLQVDVAQRPERLRAGLAVQQQPLLEAGGPLVVEQEALADPVGHDGVGAPTRAPRRSRPGAGGRSTARATSRTAEIGGGHGQPLEVEAVAAGRQDLHELAVVAGHHRVDVDGPLGGHHDRGHRVGHVELEQPEHPGPGQLVADQRSPGRRSGSARTRPAGRPRAGAGRRGSARSGPTTSSDMATVKTTATASAGTSSTSWGPNGVPVEHDQEDEAARTAGARSGPRRSRPRTAAAPPGGSGPCGPGWRCRPPPRWRSGWPG